MDANGEVVRPDPENDATEWVGQDGDDGGGLSAVTMGDPAEVAATTPVVGTAMMTAMVMMATIMAMMVMMRRDGDAAVESNTCEYYISSKPKAFRLQEGSS